jgi:uncharacterized membrane protein
LKKSSVTNWHQTHKASLTTGQKIADKVASYMGSWSFIILQSALVLLWMGLNILAFVSHWDPYPFILLNLVFSTQAAYAAPVIMMAQNRQNERDRHQADADYAINLKAETEVKSILKHLEEQNELILKILSKLESK